MIAADRLDPEVILEWMKSRHSIREFLPDAVDPEIIQRILDAANTAPSAHNAQPWRFAVVNSGAARVCMLDAMREKFRSDMESEGIPESEFRPKLERSRKRILEAPVAVLVCAEMEAGERAKWSSAAEDWMAGQSAAAAMENLLLAAHALGLGGCWIGSPLYCQEEIRDALRLPPAWRPQALALIGKPAEKPEPREKRPVADLTIEC